MAVRTSNAMDLTIRIRVTCCPARHSDGARLRGASQKSGSLLLVAAHSETCICATCGAASAFLDFGYQLPDCIWNQPESERSTRNTRDFASLGDRCFIRGLLPVPLESGEEFRYGIWLEVPRATFDEARQSWDDENRYLKLRFVGKIANAVSPWWDKILGIAVDIGGRDQGSRPFVVAAHEPWLQQIIERGWTAAEYHAAIASLR